MSRSTVVTWMRSPARSVTRRRARLREALFGLLFVTPVLVGFVVFQIGPILASLGFSLTDYNVLSPPKWIGLANYARALEEEYFAKALGNTLYYTAARIPLSVAVAFVLATLVKRSTRISTFYRSALYVPSIVPTVGSAVMWVVILNPQFGLVNRALALIGIQGPGWLVSPDWSKPSIILMNLWQTGATFVIFLAALQDIPTEYYEAASVDGAGIWHMFSRITVPLMTPTILFASVMESIYAFQVFEAAYIATAGGPLRSTYFMALYIYDNAFKFLRMGYASALSWVLFVLIMAVALALLRSSGRWTFYAGGR